MTDDPFAAFRDAVHREPALQDALAAQADAGAFVALAVRLAAERGIVLSADDVRRALDAGRRAWRERWFA